MKYFICAIDNISLGIPARWVERIIPVTRAQSVIYETEDGEGFVSLPVLFKLKDAAVYHGLILSPKIPLPRRGKSTVLLTPKIDIELDIPEENIYPLTSALSGMNRYFGGVCFTDRNMALLLDPQKLIENIAL